MWVLCPHSPWDGVWPLWGLVSGLVSPSAGSRSSEQGFGAVPVLPQGLQMQKSPWFALTGLPPLRAGLWRNAQRKGQGTAGAVWGRHRAGTGLLVALASPGGLLQARVSPSCPSVGAPCLPPPPPPPSPRGLSSAVGQRGEIQIRKSSRRYKTCLV